MHKPDICYTKYSYIHVRILSIPESLFIIILLMALSCPPTPHPSTVYSMCQFEYLEFKIIIYFYKVINSLELYFHD